MPKTIFDLITPDYGVIQNNGEWFYYDRQNSYMSTAFNSAENAAKALSDKLERERVLSTGGSIHRTGGKTTYST